jgi:hypothetical protein
MTKVSYIAGIGRQRNTRGQFIGATEASQRAGEVKPASYIEYTGLTQGEMMLALMREKARIYRDFYGDRQYQQAVDMLDNALARGLHGGLGSFIGYVPTELEGVARAISQASRLTRPASAYGTPAARPGGLRGGVHVGDPIIPTTNVDCSDEATRLANRKLNHNKTTFWYKNQSDPLANKIWTEEKQKCENKKKIEEILNRGLEKTGHHALYGYLPQSAQLPSLVQTKLRDHFIAQEEVARVAGVPVNLVQRWLDTGIMRTNVEVARIEPWNQQETNAWVTGLPEPAVRELIATLAALQKVRNPLKPVNASEEIAKILRKYQTVQGQAAIGVVPAGFIAVMGAITALVGAASEFAKSLRNQQSDAMASVRGFGTNGFGPQEGDYKLAGDENGNGAGAGGSDNSKLLLYGGLALGAYVLLK